MNLDPVVIDINFLNILIGTLIPLAVGALARLNASSGFKAVLNAVLSALAAALQVVLASCASENFCSLEWTAFLSTFFVTWVTSVATYYGLWKPTNTAQTVQHKTSNFGIGG